MKKLLVLLLCVCSLFAFTACANKETKVEIQSFTSLKNHQTLFVGEDLKFKNCVDTTVTDEYLVYEKDAFYDLKRSSTYKTDAILFGGYYYYWESNIIREEVLLGQKTVLTTIEFSYLSLGSGNENILVKRTTTQKTSYNYDGGFVEKLRACTVNLNGYFESVDEMQTSCLDLYNQIDISSNKYYYVDVTTPNVTNSGVQEFSETYFYLEQE